ncbi:MAG: hypothetical protein RBU37_10035 [Myxococcota bacterium]|jgi:hypothetical protein|nr:hypothetical protein [Myxococcota bacterium]
MSRANPLRFRRFAVLTLAASLCLSATLWSAPASAESESDRFSAGGYFRVFARPDFDGGWSKLGLWNLYGRLLNEGPWAALELKLDVLQQTPGSKDVWTSLHAKIEGGSVKGADVFNGGLGSFAMTQLYVKAGNVLFDNVVWQLGTIDTYFGDLGLYDMRPAELFFETLGLSATWQTQYADVLLGVGDSGYFLHGDQYNTVLTFGGAVRVRPLDGLEFGLGGQAFYEPAVEGNRFAPHKTTLPDYLGYEDYLRGRIISTFASTEGLGSVEAVAQDFPRPEPVSLLSWKAIAYLGFGKLGPLKWNNLFANFTLKHPQKVYRESYQGQSFDIYVTELTDERYQLNVGDEMQLELIPGWFDMVLGMVLGNHYDNDNELSATEEDRFFWSVVARGQVYLSNNIHVLVETSFASEESKQGSLWRGHYDSIFQNNEGVVDAEGFEYGDLDTRQTWQLKAGLILNPTGTGIFSRPSIRLLYGLQHSNMHNAFGNSFVQSQADYEVFRETADRHLHQIISLEAEAWF